VRHTLDHLAILAMIRRHLAEQSVFSHASPAHRGKARRTLTAVT
jgi:hypothetical protein